MEKPRRLPNPLDGRAIFENSASVKGLSIGWERVRANGGSAGGDGMTIDAFAASAGARIADGVRLARGRLPGQGRCASSIFKRRAAGSPMLPAAGAS